MTQSSRPNQFPRFDFLEAEFERLTAEADRAAATKAHRRLVGFSAVSVATVVAAVASLVLIGPGGEGSLGPPPAQAALQRFADDAANDDSLTARAGQFLYQRQLTQSDLDPTFHPESGGPVPVPDDGSQLTIETWIDNEGNGSVVTRHGAKLLEGQFGGGGPASFGGQLNLSYEQVLNLPRDPAALLSHLRELEARTSGGVIGALGTLLATPLPLDLQAALLDAAALVPGAELEEEIKAPNGQNLTAVSYEIGSDAAMKYELLFNPTSGSYRGHSIAFADGRRFYGSLILERGVVDEVGTRP